MQLRGVSKPQILQRASGKRSWRTVLKFASPYLYLGPAFIVLGLFVFYPLIRTVQISFYRWNLVSPNRTFIGLDNYASLLTDPMFGQLLWQSTLYLLLALVGNFILPIALALLTLQVSRKEADIYQSLLFLPTVVAANIATLIWVWFYLPGVGLFNVILGSLGFDSISWLNSPSTALPAVSLVANWKYLGFHFLIALAGLSAIPKEFVEAARVDGAQGWGLVRNIILPLFAPTALFLLLSTLIQGLDYVFVPIDVLTAGGPAGSTNNLMYAVYQDGFKYFRAGRAAAFSVVLIFVFAILIYWQYRMFERNIHYDR